MQLVLTSEEFNLLEQILQKQERSCGATPLLGQVLSKGGAADKLPMGCDLLGRTLSISLPLDLDELQNLADSLNAYKSTLMTRLAALRESGECSNAQHQLAILEHLLEKVIEACAMV